MRKIVGITGKRGAGKTTISWLIGNCIEYLENNKSIDFNTYCNWCDQIVNDVLIPYKANMRYVYYDSFQDGLLTLISNLTGISYLDLRNKEYKDTTYIDLSDFSVCKDKDFKKEYNLFCAKMFPEYIEYHNGIIPQYSYMSIREFILYFGHEMMKKFFGSNIWTKIIDTSFDPTDYEQRSWKIYEDVKTQAEYDFIRKYGGVIINVDRTTVQTKTSVLDANHKDWVIDYNIIIDSDLKNMYNPVVEVAINIYKLIYGKNDN